MRPDLIEERGSNGEAKRRGVRWTREAVALTALGVIQWLWLMGLVLAGDPESIVAKLTIDDTYYYLQIAWNTWHEGLVSFDGIHRTNGVQLLWFGLLTPLAGLAPTKLAFLKLTLGLSYALNVACYALIWRVMRPVREDWPAWLMIGCWAVLIVFRPFLWGMEASLHGFVFWLVIWRLVVFERSRGSRELWVLTLVLVLNAWVRLDSAVFSAVVFVYALWGFRARRRAIFVAVAIAFLGAAIQLVAFRAMGGSFLPVSAQIKAWWGPLDDMSLLPRMWQAFRLSFPPILPQRLAWDGVPVAALILGAAGLLLRREAKYVRLALLCMGATLVYILAVAASGAAYHPAFSWYRTPQYVSWLIWLVIGGLGWSELISHRFRAGGLVWALRMGSLGLILFGFYRLVMLTRDTPDEKHVLVSTYRAGVWLREHTAEDEISASWRSGIIGYFSHRQVVNLDGLVNSPEYFETYLRGKGELSEYLASLNVIYVVDSLALGPTDDWPVVHRMPAEADEQTPQVKIWGVESHQAP